MSQQEPYEVDVLVCEECLPKAIKERFQRVRTYPSDRNWVNVELLPPPPPNITNSVCRKCLERKPIYMLH